ncbi:hypothetical protein [Neosynechococcus sphagnicola]|uniref:hypothetical protein n=1 Tax=Neosynechococcus sphagnicola TaxID=1501145 RepID=UPI00068E21CF|nr:hypothetical protein [Neosynechococcus sphagnicola]
MTKETWIVFKAHRMDAHGWQERRLQPFDSFTDILHEEWDSSGREDKLPKPGDRVREYANLDTPGDGVTHGRDGDWIVTRVQHFSSFDTDTRIVICYCEYQPALPNWEPVHRGQPVDELLQPVEA